MAAEHYGERGYRNFAYFSLGSNRWSHGFYKAFRHFAEERWKGNVSACPLIQRKARPFFNATTVSREDEQLILEWLRSLPKPVGIFCTCDINASFLLNMCMVADIAVPDEAAVLGVGNNDILFQASNPPLSSINPNGQTTGFQAAQLLDRRIQKIKDPPLPIWIPPLGVVVRKSTDNIAVDHPDFVAALRYIRDNATQRISVNDVVEYVQVSRRTLYRWFRKYIQRSPEKEILRVKMQRAGELLLETNENVELVGRQVGYPWVGHFIRTFRKYYGMTPKTFRSEMKNYAEK